MIIPDPIPLVDEFLILAGTILLSRWADLGARGASGASGAGAATGSSRRSSSGPARAEADPMGAPKHVGRSSTAR
jgi:hypothetical protein